jgi:outer membrane protein, multidrug efflux system
VKLNAAAKLAAVPLFASWIAACTVGPNYKRPPIEVPQAFRGQPVADIAAASGPEALAEQNWPQVFQDEALQALIRTALEHNYDLQAAAVRVLQAQAQLGITRADQFPTVSAGLDVLGERPAGALGFPTRNIGAVDVQGSVSWEVDFWGKFRRATEAARAQLLAS